MNLEQEAREFAEARTKGIESHSTLTEQLVAFASKVLAEQNRDLIAERDGLKERVGIAKEAFRKIDEFQPSGEMMSDLSIYLNMAAECKRIAREALSKLEAETKQ